VRHHTMRAGIRRPARIALAPPRWRRCQRGKKAAAVETLAAGLAREASLRAAAEIGAVVDMDGVGQSGNGPFFFYFALGQPCGFVVNRVKKTQTNRESRRRIHGQVESGHSAHENIHGQGDPRPTNRFARFLIDDGDIHPRVIDLDILKGRVARYSPAVALVTAILSLSSRRRACFRKSNSASLARTARQLGEARPSWTQRRRISSTRRANDARSGVKIQPFNCSADQSIALRIVILGTSGATAFAWRQCGDRLFRLEALN
jgi:hypothetical protein